MKYKKYQHQKTLRTVQGNSIEGYSSIAPNFWFSVSEIEKDCNWILIS